MTNETTNIEIDSIETADEARIADSADEAKLALISHDFDHQMVGGNVKSAMFAAEATKRDMYFVPFAQLVILDDFNVRPRNADYDAEVRMIADSIKENGFYSHKPLAVIVIQQGGKEIIAVYDGHTRYDALKIAISEGADIKKIPVVAAAAGTTLEDITVGLVTNNNGRQLDPMAIAVVCKRLIGYGFDNAKIAKRLGFTPPYVSGLLNLVGAPKKIRDMVNNGTLSASLAVSTLREEGENAIEILESGLENAIAAGKKKVTAKNLPPKEEKVGKKVDGVKAIRKRPIIEVGLEWIDENGGMEHSYALLSAITGIAIDDLKKRKM